MSLAVRITLLRQLTRIDLPRFGPKLAEALITRSHQVSVRRAFVRPAHRRGKGTQRPTAGDPRWGERWVTGRRWTISRRGRLDGAA
ncbi:hypothetical protein AB0J14_13890 [Micromonospora arborensis]|uniref:hypothetical protein n=1 Tax=Micromonospora arborensis TaxID=2116518 RepID=UPI003402C7B2